MYVTGGTTDETTDGKEGRMADDGTDETTCGTTEGKVALNR